MAKHLPQALVSGFLAVSHNILDVCPKTQVNDREKQWTHKTISIIKTYQNQKQKWDWFTLTSDWDQFKWFLICSFVNHPRFWRRDNFLLWVIVFVSLETNMSYRARKPNLYMTYRYDDDQPYLKKQTNHKIQGS